MTGPGPTYHAARQLLVRGVGGVAAAAFVSLRAQLDGLYGARGIRPIADTLAELARVGAARGMSRWSLGRAVPTVFWLDASDPALRLACDAGLLAAALAACGVLQGPALLVAWGLYLAFAAAGGPFLDYQWDGLLLESLLVAAAVAPWSLRARVIPADRAVRAGLWVARLLLFKLMFLSGVVKLASGDPTWRELRALSFHFFTQPLPNPLSAWAHGLPAVVHRALTAATLVIELLLPWFIPGPRRLRRVALAGFTLLQFAIALTGNYGFFNALTVVLALSLADDELLGHAPLPRAAPAPTDSRPRALAVATLAVLAALRLAASLAREVPAPVAAVLAGVAPFRSVNAYGLFAVMTTDRPEVIVEGSDDGVTWRPFHFRWKPGELTRAPGEAWFHLPRLDWQLWFAALAGDCGRARWYLGLARRLLDGSAPVRSLLAADPFPGAAPRFVRATLYDYRPRAAGEGVARGAHWSRRPLRPFCPTLTRDGDRIVPAP